MFGKRGQEGVTLGTLILLILGGVALVVIILGFTMGWGFIFGKIGLLPGQSIQVLAKSCEISVNQELGIDYCAFKEVRVEGESEKRWVNCEYGPVGTELEGTVSSAALGKVKCPDTAAQTKCNDLAAAGEIVKEESVMINSKTCKLNAEGKGQLVDASASAAA